MTHAVLGEGELTTKSGVNCVEPTMPVTSAEVWEPHAAVDGPPRPYGPEPQARKKSRDLKDQSQSIPAAFV